MKTEDLKNWGDGINKIINCDYREYIKIIPDKSIDLLLTDPPYNYKMNGGGSLGKKYKGYQDRVNNLGDFNAIEFLELVRPKIKVFNAYVWCGKELLLEITTWAKEKKLNWNILIWGKPNPMPAYNNTYLPDIEFCVFMREKGALFNNGLGYEMYRRVLIHPIGNTGLAHPTVKPLWIIERAVKISSKENDLVFDPFMGSGTTALACVKNKRNFIGCEIKEEYYKICEERLTNIQMPLFN